MKQFLDKNFLLTNEISQQLYHDYACNCPILDYHCHINPQEIFEDRKFDNITQVWLGGDHYKWRQMRTNGIEECYITGDAPDYEKFVKWAQTLELAIGNPLYHWSHMELKKYFGYDGCLNSKTADEVWNICNAKLHENGMSVRNMIKQSDVNLICTTDDPVDSLEWHKKIAADNSFDVHVLPTWRPDKAMNIGKAEFVDYITKLGSLTNNKITSFAALLLALSIRMDFFAEMGCTVSDHALEYIMYQDTSADEVEAIFQKRLAGESISSEEIIKYQTAFMLFVAKEYHNRNWVMQLHYGCKRDNNQAMYEKLGSDTGCDCISNYAPAAQMADFLNALSVKNALPKTIVYSLNPNDNAAIDTLLGCFQDSSAIGKLQHGSAWWFNDHRTGMIEQMTSLANLGLLSNFIGMLTDSRSFLSYTRHDYFRRILCNLIGEWVYNGEYPKDMAVLEKIIKAISYNNAAQYFNFPLDIVK